MTSGTSSNPWTAYFRSSAAAGMAHLGNITFQRNKVLEFDPKRERFAGPEAFFLEGGYNTVRAMALFRNFISRAIREFASDPENQEKAKKLYADEVAPRAKEFWKKAEPDVKKAGQSALKGAAKAAVEIKKRWQERDR